MNRLKNILFRNVCERCDNLNTIDCEGIEKESSETNPNGLSCGLDKAVEEIKDTEMSREIK